MLKHCPYQTKQKKIYLNVPYSEKDEQQKKQRGDRALKTKYPTMILCHDNLISNSDDDIETEEKPLYTNII